MEVIEPVSQAGGAKLLRFGGSESNGLYPTESEASLVHQQELTNCPLLAVLSALVHTCPKQIESIIREIPGTPVSKIFGNGEPKVKPRKLFRVNFSDGDERRVSDLVYFRYNRPVYGYSSDHTSWVPLIEKAYVLRKAEGFVYEGLNANVTLEYAMVDLLGPSLKVEITSGGAKRSSLNFDEAGVIVDRGKNKQLSDEGLLDLLRKSERMATIAGHATEWHTYTVLRVEAEKIEVREAMRGKTKKLSVSEFKAEFDSIIQAQHHRECGR